MDRKPGSRPFAEVSESHESLTFVTVGGLKDPSAPRNQCPVVLYLAMPFLKPSDMLPIRLQTPTAAHSERLNASASVKPTVTVVVPNFDHARYLRRSLRSIAEQTHSPDRVLIVDDASTDESVDIISQFLFEHPNWRLIRHSKRQGVVFGLNEGLIESDTEWITFLGADDILHPSYLAKTLQQAVLNPTAGLICSCCEVIGESKNRILRPIVLPAASTGVISSTKFRGLLRTGDNYFLGTVTLYRREAIRSLGGFDQSLGAFTDGFLARRLALRFGFSFIPEILGYWRVHGRNYSVITSTNPHTISEKLGRIREVITADRDLFPDQYDELFERRTHFGSARQILMAKPSSYVARAQQIAILLGSKTLVRLSLTVLLSLGRPGEILILAWLTIQLRPMSIWKLIRDLPLRRAILARAGAGSVP